MPWLDAGKSTSFQHFFLVCVFFVVLPKNRWFPVGFRINTSKRGQWPLVLAFSEAPGKVAEPWHSIQHPCHVSAAVGLNRKIMPGTLPQTEGTFSGL